MLLFFDFIANKVQANSVFLIKKFKIENDGNLILSTNSTAKIPNEDILINGDKAIYNKLISSNN